MFAIIVVGSEQKNSMGTVVGDENERYWVIEDTEGWVAATSVPLRYWKEVPNLIKQFDSKEEARMFAQSWEGHPWWCKPKSFEIVEIRERYELVPVGYEVKE